MDLTVKVAGTEFKNPLVATSGPLGRTFMAVKKSIEAGAGGVTLKSCGHLPEGWPEHKLGWYTQPRPTHKFLMKNYEAPFGLMHNWEGCPPVSFDAEMEAELLHKIMPIAKEHNCKISASVNVDVVYHENKELFRKDLRTVLQAKPDLLEGSPSCWMAIWPRPIWSAAERQERVHEMAFIAQEEAEKANIPTIHKSFGGLLRGAEEEIEAYKKRIAGYRKRGIRAVYGMGAIPLRTKKKDVSLPELPAPEGRQGVFIDLRTRKPSLVGPHVGTYGVWHRPGANLSTALLKAEGWEVVGSGGVWTVYDCIERLMCGASLVGVCTAVHYHGQKLIGTLIAGVSDFLDRKGLSLDQIIGAAVPSIVSWDAYHEFMAQREVPKESLRVEIDIDKCTACGLCANCIYGAMEMKDSVPTWDKELCERCGVCESLCAPEAITIKQKIVQKIRG